MFKNWNWFCVIMINYFALLSVGAICIDAVPNGRGCPVYYNTIIEKPTQFV